MATSYKTLYQQAKEAADRAQEELQELRRRATVLRTENVALPLLAAGVSDAERLRAQRALHIVDLGSIARHMQVGRNTPVQWRQRRLLPPVDFPDLAEPLWYATTIIEQFANPSGRTWTDQPSGDAARGAE